MRSNIKRNYILNLIQQILALITPLITTPYISRVIGAEGIGIYSYTSSIASYFALFAALGTISYGQREISYVQDNREKRTIVFWNTVLRSFITTSICFVAYGIFTYFQRDYRQIFAILSISIIEVALNITWLFMGMEEFGKIVKRNIVVRFLNIAFIFLFVKKTEDLPIYVLGVTAVTGIGHLSLWPYLPQYIGLPKLKKLHPFHDFKTVITLFIPTIAISIYTVLDKTMIGILTSNPAENGYYEQAIKITIISLTFVTALGAVMVPRIGALFAKKNTRQIQDYMYKSYRFVCFLGIPFCLGIIGTSSNFVPWFFGPSFEAVIPVLNTLSFIIIMTALSNTTGIQYLVPTQRQNYLTLSVIIGAVVNFSLNLIIIPIWGAIGAAWTSVVAECCVTAIQLCFVRKEISSFVILKNSINYIFAGGLMFIGLLLLGNNLSPTFAHTSMLATAGILIYVLALLILRDKFFFNNVLTIWKKVRNAL